MALDLLGICPAGLNGVPAFDPDKEEAAREAGRLAMRLVRDDVRPSQIITRESIDNAIAGIAASGGSTNGVLHLLAIAWELGIPLTIDDFDTIGRAHADRGRPHAGRALRRHRPPRGRRRRP